MTINSHKTIIRLLASSATLLFAPVARATVGPPVEIKMAADTKAAVSGQEYAGVWEVHVYRAGTLTDFRLEGEGWTLRSVDWPSGSGLATAGTLRIPFRAIPSDADRPIALSLTYNGRKVRQQYSIGPAYFAQAGKPKPSRRVPNTSGLRQPLSLRAAGGLQAETSTSITRGGTIRCVGRIVYTRSDAEVVGADRIDVRVLDVDIDADDEIWSGWTDEYGFFDTGERPIPSDSDGSGPDLVLYYDTSTTDWVDVTDNSIDESTYWWDTGEITDFEGNFHDFGWTTPAATSLHPAIHIFNSITRARRYIMEKPGYITPEVQVEWPDDSKGGGAWYDDGANEIHVSTEREWREDTHTHEYGHHFVDSLYEPDPPDPDYCNGMCDGDGCDGTDCESEACENPGHCMWCAETDHDAFNEGWPNWLADVVTRDYPIRYQLDGSPYEPLFTRDQETPERCGSFFDNVITTEGFIGALLRDIEDAGQDDHDGDGIFDLLCLGPNPNFTVVATHQPITVLDFINGFRADFPQHTGSFFATAFNVGGAAYVGGFPADAQAPSVATDADSPTHPIGVGGPLPCITFEFSPASDDATGACVYSYAFSFESTGVTPDEIPEPVLPGDKCKLQGFAVLEQVGDYYLKIRARDIAGNWSSGSTTFGPFTVTECNDNGVIDLCDIDCYHPAAGPCPAFSWAVCSNQDGCGTGSDCQPNFVPDVCDLAEGTSEDCNINVIPDECEPMKHWVGGVSELPSQGGGCCYWHNGGNWEEGSAPAFADEICIPVTSTTPTLRRNAYTVGTLACYQDLMMIQAPGLPLVDLTLLEPSFILGDLTMGAPPGYVTRLQVDDELTISGSLNWSSGLIRGAGQTFVTGGHSITGGVQVLDHTLNLQCNTLVTGGYITGGYSTIRNFPGFTYTQAEGIVHQANGLLLVNEGTILKPSGSGVTRLDSPVHNSGEIRAHAGSIRIGPGLICSGSILGLPGTTLEFNGSMEFEPSSSLVGDQIVFNASAPPNSRNIRGAYDAVAGTTIQAGANVTFHPESDVIDYGDVLVLTSAIGHFDAVVGSTINFQSITVGGSSTAYFTSGDPIVTDTLTLASSLAATIRGANKNITVNGLFTWNNGGSILDSGVINANGGLILTACSSVKNLQCVLNNAAIATIQGCFEVSQGGAVHNLATGVWDIQVDGTVIYGGTLVFSNAGTLVKSAGAGTSTIGTGSPAFRPQITNTGTVEVQAGVLAISWGSYTQTAGQTLLNGGNLSMTGSPAMPLQLDGGSLTGTGTVTANVNNAGGSVDPGLSPGQLNITGNYTQAAGGALEIELGGPTQGIGFDWLNVSGTASLSGTLRVGLIGGFTPAIGQQFVVLSAGSRSGTFAAVESLTPGLTVDVLYGPTTVTLEITGIGVPAAAITGAVSRKVNAAGPGGVCDLPLLPLVKSEPRAGGVTELRIAFDVPPGGPGTDPVTIEERVCPAPGSYGPYTGSSVISSGITGNVLVLTFTPGLENLHTYRLTMNPGVTSLPGQSVEVRGLVGDVDGSGRVNGADRSFVVSVWTSPANFSCTTDLDNSGRTNGADRSIVVSAWTSVQNCAP